MVYIEPCIDDLRKVSRLAVAPDFLTQCQGIWHMRTDICRQDRQITTELMTKYIVGFLCNYHYIGENSLEESRALVCAVQVYRRKPKRYIFGAIVNTFDTGTYIQTTK